MAPKKHKIYALINNLGRKSRIFFDFLQYDGENDLADTKT